MLTIRPCFYVSAPSGRQSCRNIAVPRPHAWGGGISLRLRRAACSLRSVSLCAACRPASGIARHPAARQLENRSYGFKELAVLYFPNIAPASASIRLKAWIKDSPELLQALDETHYHLTARVLTPRQKDLIAVAFGSPF